MSSQTIKRKKIRDIIVSRSIAEKEFNFETAFKLLLHKEHDVYIKYMIRFKFSPSQTTIISTCKSKKLMSIISNTELKPKTLHKIIEYWSIRDNHKNNEISTLVSLAILEN